MGAPWYGKLVVGPLLIQLCQPSQTGALLVLPVTNTCRARLDWGLVAELNLFCLGEFPADRTSPKISNPEIIYSCEYLVDFKRSSESLPVTKPRNISPVSRTGLMVSWVPNHPADRPYRPGQSTERQRKAGDAWP